MLSVHTLPTAAGKRSLWRPGVESIKDRSTLTSVSSNVTDIPSTSSTTEFRQVTATTARPTGGTEPPQLPTDKQQTSTDAGTSKLKHFFT